MMKKIISVFFAILLLATPFLLTSCGKSDEGEEAVSGETTTLYVYNWGEYISDGEDDTLDVNAEFEKLYGIKVNYTNFESNENMYNKLKGGGANYDVIIPSDYMIARLVEEDMLLELDFSNIPNYKYILDKYKGLYYDPDNKYSVPYTASYTGLIYNTKMVDEVPDSWGALWDEKYAGNILMFNNPRDAFAIAQFYLGQDVNNASKEDWDAALAVLKAQNPLVSSYVMDEVFDKMEGGDAALAPYYVGDFLSMQENNPDLGFVYPKEGVNYFVDAMCVPKGAQNKEAAELYINYMLSEEAGVANANYICYGSPNSLVLESDDYELKDDPYLYPEEGTVKSQIFENLDSETLNYMTGLWNELKIEGNSMLDAYIGLSVTALAAVAFAVYKTVKKKKREAMY